MSPEDGRGCSHGDEGRSGEGEESREAGGELRCRGGSASGRDKTVDRPTCRGRRRDCSGGLNRGTRHGGGRAARVDQLGSPATYAVH